MNNKYQEALNKIKNKLTTVEYLQPLQATNKSTTFQEAFERAEGIEMTIEREEELKTLQELVDKETPKKMTETTSYSTTRACLCPICHKRWSMSNRRKYKYCPNCGQKLDWSEENGNNN